MSGIWSEFDPLGRAKPAAPVTSMQQISAVPSFQKSKNAETKAENKTEDTEVSSKDKEEETTKEQPANSSSKKESSNDSNKDSTESEDKDAKATESEEPVKESAEQPAKEPIKEPVKESTQDSKNDSTGNSDSANQNTNESTTSKSTPSEPTPSKPTTSKPTTSKPTPSEPLNEPNEDDEKVNLSLSGDISREVSPSNEVNAEISEEINQSASAPADSGSASGSAAATDSAADTSADFDASQVRRPSLAELNELSENSKGGPSFDYQAFMTSLRTKSAEPIARYIKSFLHEFHRGAWTPAQQERILADFQRFISVKLRDYEPFKSMSKQERKNSMEGVEKLITTRLYTRLFPPVMAPILRTDGHNEDLMRDQLFEKKMRLWGWVEGRHLDINEQYLQSTFTKLAEAEISKMHQFKSPRDKMICVLNCSKVIFALIRQAQLEQNADSFLPLLIYVVLKAHPTHLVSSLNYIQRFRNREQLQGETAYYLSTIESAVAFVSSLDKQNLTISDDEFEQRMNDACQAETNRIKEQQAEEQLQFRRNGGTHHPGGAHEGESSAAVITASANMLMEQFKTFTTKILDDISTPAQGEASGSEASANAGAGATQGTTANNNRETQRRLRNDERAARQASREDYATEQAQREQFNETVDTLVSMFPLLDREVIADVLQQNGTDVGSAVDICLALVGQ